MRTIQLKINDNIYDKLIWFLSKFSKDEVEVISVKDEFHHEKQYLQRELNEMNSANVSFISEKELVKRLDSVLNKYEDNL